MKVPIAWLSEFIEPGLPVRELAERLTMTGTMVDGVARHGVPAFDHFVVGHVLSAEQHPDADRLKVCTVDIGEAEPATIVCGAPNVAAGQTVAVARPGAVMPDGTKLKKAKLRGVASEGMILAEDELAIGADRAGILVFAAQDAARAPGTPLGDVLPFAATDVLELEITPNRPDCLGVYGVAREVHAATGAALSAPPWAGSELPALGDIEGVQIEVRDSERCPRFTALAYENVTIAPSPTWLKAALSAAGQRPINNVVDITNYVMLLTGQPLHAFDLDKIAGGRLVVRGAVEGEKVTTLDGQARVMPPEAMVIDDADGPTSIAGIMGGERSEVSLSTTRVLMEVATWDGASTHAAAEKLGLRSEAGTRNAKGLSPESAVQAQIVARSLMAEICGATARPGFIDIGGEGAAAKTIRLRAARVTGLLGTSVDPAEQVRVLEALGCEVARVDAGLDVTVPHWRRNDLTREADLVEEVARLLALEDLPSTLPRQRPGARLTWSQMVRRRAEDVLVGRGAYEIAGWSLVAPELLDRLRLPADSPMRAVVALENPMSEEQSIMRPTLLGSLLDAARHNVSRGREGVALFDSGNVYRHDPERDDELVDEHHGLGLVITGPVAPAGWGGDAAPPQADFFTAKGLLAAVLDTLRVPWGVTPEPWPFLHPGRSALIHSGERRLGFIGELHPLVAQAWDLDVVAAFAIDLGAVAELAVEVPEFEDLTSFPPVRQDLSLLTGERGAAEIVATITRVGGRLLRDVEIFDRFERQGAVSIALHLSFAASDRTLTDDEVDALRAKILAALADEGVTARA